MVDLKLSKPKTTDNAIKKVAIMNLLPIGRICIITLRSFYSF